MGYTTDFRGEFEISPPLQEKHRDYLNAFAYIRHMGRDVGKLKDMPDPKRIAVNMPLGKEGEYYVGSSDDQQYGQFNDGTILDHNQQASTQPGLWCQWVPTEDGTALVWDEGEKFYNYIEWLEYIIENFMKPWGYTLNGEVLWQGEGFSDIGKIKVNDNNVKTSEPRWDD